MCTKQSRYFCALIHQLSCHHVDWVQARIAAVTQTDAGSLFIVVPLHFASPFNGKSQPFPFWPMAPWARENIPPCLRLARRSKGGLTDLPPLSFHPEKSPKVGRGHWYTCMRSTLWVCAYACANVHEWMCFAGEMCVNVRCGYVQTCRCWRPMQFSSVLASKKSVHVNLMCARGCDFQSQWPSPCRDFQRALVSSAGDSLNVRFSGRKFNKFKQCHCVKAQEPLPVASLFYVCNPHRQWEFCMPFRGFWLDGSEARLTACLELNEFMSGELSRQTWGSVQSWLCSAMPGTGVVIGHFDPPQLFF